MAGPGSADFKSNVLSRDEKGFLGVPFKRLLLAGVGGGLIYSLTRFTGSNWAIPLAILVGVMLLVMSSPRGGIPRWQRLLYRFRGSLIVAMADAPGSVQASLGRFFELQTDVVVLDGATIFAPVSEIASVQVDWSQWVTFSEARHAATGDGLVIVDGPQPHHAVESELASVGGRSA